MEKFRTWGLFATGKWGNCLKNRENSERRVEDYVNGVMHKGIHRGRKWGGDKCVDNVDKLRKFIGEKGTASKKLKRKNYRIQNRRKD